MPNPQGGTPMEKYLSQKSELERLEGINEKMKNKESDSYYKRKDKIEKLSKEVEELEKHKDDMVLSKSCIAYLDQRVKENVYGRRQQLKTFAVQKGTECESEAVHILNKALNQNYKKSKYAKGEKMENERCTGHEDIDAGDYTIDTKVSESMDQFPILTDELDNKYWRQGQGYMRLKGENYKKHIVAKVLVNSPARQVKNMLYIAYLNMSKKYEGVEEHMTDELNEMERNIFLGHVFDQQLIAEGYEQTLQLSEKEVMPDSKRVRLFDFERDNEAIEKIKKRVEECRIYLAQQGY